MAFRNLFNHRKRRKQRRRNVGTGFPNPTLVVEGPASGIPSPITNAQGADKATIVFTFESTGPQYPGGTLFSTGADMTLFGSFNGSLTLAVPSDFSGFFLSVDVSDPSIPGGGVTFGKHTIAIYVEDEIGFKNIALFLDGVQIGQSLKGGPWGNSVATWSYMDGVTDIGRVGKLKVFPGFTPPGFVG